MEEQVKKKRSNEVVRIAKVPLAGVAGGFAISALLALFFLGFTINGQHSDALANQQADAIAFQINQRERQLLQQMQGAATSILLTQLVTQDDATARSIEESRLRELIPDALRVRLIPLGTAQVDRSASPPFSFTSKDLVNRVERGEDVFSEAINANGTWVLSLAAPIRTPSEETVRGTLFVWLEMEALSSGLNEIVQGQIFLDQRFGNAEPNDILEVGSAGNTRQYARDLSNPNWQLRYRPSAGIAGASVGNFVELLLPSLVFLAIAMAGVWYGCRQLFGTIKTDADHLANQMAAVIAGDYTPSEDYVLADFIDLDFNLGRLGAKPKEEKKDVPKLDVKLQPKQTPANEMVDIEMIDEDEFEAAMGGGGSAPEPVAEAESAPDLREIFRAYDIRGVVNETLTPDVIHRIGQAIGTEAQDLGERTMIVGYDGRVSSPMVAEALIEGLNASGCDVINIGMVPTPLMYFATHNSDNRSGVMVTASHNPPDYNGFKIVIDGRTLTGDDIDRIYEKFESGDFANGAGSASEIDITQDYMDAIIDDVVVAQPLKVVIDCGNGVAGSIAPDLIENLGCDVISLYCDVDGNFPNHMPDTGDPANLADLIQMVKAEAADIGIAIDGDGDRLVAVTGSGEIVWPDRLMMLFAKDVVSRNPGSDVVYDVKCTRHLNGVISGFGGRPIICRSGHSFVKAKIQETNAILGGEMSGHICFGERWYGFDDGMYSAARLLEIVGSQTEGLDELLAEFPNSVSTPEILIRVNEADKFRLIDKITKIADFGDASLTKIDGIRADFASGWGLIRASNTSAALTLRFEADDESTLQQIKDLFREQIQIVDATLDF